MAGARELHRDGKEIAEELRELPAAAYVVESEDGASSLSSDDEQGIAQAIASLRAGHGRTTEQVRQRIESLRRK